MYKLYFKNNFKTTGTNITKGVIFPKYGGQITEIF